MVLGVYYSPKEALNDGIDESGYGNKLLARRLVTQRSTHSKQPYWAFHAQVSLYLTDSIIDGFFLEGRIIVERI